MAEFIPYAQPKSDATAVADAIKQARKTLDSLSDTTAGQINATIPKLKAAVAELQRQQVLIQGQADDLQQQADDLQQQANTLQALVDRLQNVSAVSWGQFTDTRDTGGDVNTWWEGAKPSVSATSLSGRFMATFGGSGQASLDVSSSNLYAKISFSGDGVDRADVAKGIAAMLIGSASKTVFFQRDPGSTLTLTLEWTHVLRAGWISLQPML